MIEFKKYETFVDQVNPVTKLIIAILLFPLVIFIHNPNTMLYLIIGLLFYLLFLTGAKFKYIFILIIFMIFFGVISSTYMIFYGYGETTIFKFGIIHITEESLIRAVHIMMRGMVLTVFGGIIIFTTRITSVFYSLMQQLKIKPKYAYSFMASIRMVPIIYDEYMSLKRIKKVRAPLIHRKYVKGIYGFKQMIVTLLSQSIRRAYRLGLAMESKGFDDGTRTYYYVTRWTYRDIIFLLLIIATVLISVYLGDHFLLFNTRDAR